MQAVQSENSSTLKIAWGGHGNEIVVGNDRLECNNYSIQLLNKLHIIIVVLRISFQHKKVVRLNK